MTVCEICGATGDEADAIYFPSSDLMKAQTKEQYNDHHIGFDSITNNQEIAMLHGACIRIEVESGNMRIIDDRIIESLQLYCTHFGGNAMPNKIGDDEHA